MRLSQPYSCELRIYKKLKNLNTEYNHHICVVVERKSLLLVIL